MRLRLARRPDACREAGLETYVEGSSHARRVTHCGACGLHALSLSRHSKHRLLRGGRLTELAVQEC